MFKKIIKLSEKINQNFRRLIFGRTGKKCLNRRIRRSLYRFTKNNNHAYIPFGGGLILGGAAGFYFGKTARRKISRQLH